jgi:hypothetical protein
MWHCRGSFHAGRAGSMMLVRTAMPVRGVIRDQAARAFGWKRAGAAANRHDGPVICGSL